MGGGGAAGEDEVDGEAGDRGVGVDDVEASVGEGAGAGVMVALMAAGGGFRQKRFITNRMALGPGGADCGLKARGGGEAG